MGIQSQTKLNRFLNEHIRKKRWLNIVTALCLAVAFITSYSLINPAITMEQETFCGFEEHIEHDESCFEKVLVCGLEEGGHAHSEECYEERRVLICEFSEGEGHVHTEDCYASEDFYSCGLEETEGHVHSEDCYTTEEYYSCGIEETGGHVHSEDCYAAEEYYSCGLEESEGHIHTDDCYETETCYSCGLEESEGHNHSEACYETEEYLSCALEETDGHQHGPECYMIEVVLVCDCPDEDHEHTEECYEERESLSCGLEEQELHHHDEGCYSEREILVCGLEESEGHHHGESCVTETRELVCGLEEFEGHHHDEGCVSERQVLSCGLEESEGHHHDENCISERQALSCGLEESEPHIHDGNCIAQRQILVCTEEETAPHVHDDGCYMTEVVCVCEMKASEVHQHTEECYAVDYDHPVCELPIHEHTLQCFSNPDADVEDPGDWEESTADAVITGNWNSDVIAVAETQLGYTESALNYEVQEDGVTMKGYTRYGDWYGDDYGDWCAMFASFCLNYAGVDGDIMPFESSCDRWIQKLQQSEDCLYRPYYSYRPVPGDLVFFDFDDFDPECENDRAADHVAIVAGLEYDEETREPVGFYTIEGNWNDRVCSNYHSIDSGTVLGYGILPKNPEWFVMTAETETGILVTVEGLRSSLPYDAEDVVLTADEIVSEESSELLASRLEEDGAEDMDAVLLDVSLWHIGEDGDESAENAETLELIEPVGPVYLSFVSEDVDADSAVYHIDEENETVTDMTAEVNEFESVVSLETEHFSTFALTLRPKAGKTVTANVSGEWNSPAVSLASAVISASSNDKLFFTYDVWDGDSWNVAVGPWSGKGKSAVFNVEDLFNSGSLSTRIRVRVAANTALPENDNSGYSEEFSLYDILESIKPGFTGWLSDAYTDPALYNKERPTTVRALFEAFNSYFDQPEMTLAPKTGSSSVIEASFSGYTPAASAYYVWEYYDEDEEEWATLEEENGSELDTLDYSSLTEGAEPLLDGGKTVRCCLYEPAAEGEEPVLVAVATLANVNPLKDVYDTIINTINTGLDLANYVWYLNGAKKTANIPIGGTEFTDYFYYDNVARDEDVPFYDAESYRNYLASEYRRIENLPGEDGGSDKALEHVAKIWDKYIFDIYNPNRNAGVVNNYSYYPGAKGTGPVSTYGDKIIEWPKDGASSFHTPYATDLVKNGREGETEALIYDLNYDYLEGGVDYDRFVQNVGKTATADAAGDFNTNRSYNIDITADTQASSLAPIAMLVTVQTSWQMFDYAHANCVAGDGTYTSLAVGAAQHNTEMANLYDIKKALIRFVDYMDENFPGHNLVLGINEVQHGGSYNLINYTIGGGKNNTTVYVSNNSELLHEVLNDWDTFGNCEHVHYTTDAMKDAADALESNLNEWRQNEKDDSGDFKKINYEDIRKVAVIIGGGTENTNGTNGYGCTLPWGTFYGAHLNSVYGIRTNIGTPLNADGVLSWLDYSKNNTGDPYSYGDGSGYSTGSATGNFTAKYVASTEDAVFNTLVKIAQQEINSQGVKVEDPSKNIENVTVSDTVADEFRLEPGKPFVATVLGTDGSELYKTTVTPVCDADGNITRWEASFTDNLIAHSPVSVTPTVDHVDETGATVITVPAALPYKFTTVGGSGTTQSGTETYYQKLVITPNADGTTDVSFDFGTVYSGNDAKLHFEVVAKDDYIGSNNVFTNEGTPEVSFKHTKKTEGGEPGEVLEYDPVQSYDTPEVNVPIRFDVVNGTEVTVKVNTPVYLEDLSTSERVKIDETKEPDDPGYIITDDSDDDEIVDSEVITANVHNLIDNYDQINGTVSYTWILPGGKEIKVPITLHVTDGVPDGPVTDSAEMAYEWIPKTSGIYDIGLRVTFTPDPVVDHGNFADDGGVTATRVTKHDEVGHETVKVLGGPAGSDGTTTLTVSKVWSGEKGDTSHRPDSITFNVLQDGEFYDQYTINKPDEGQSWESSHTFEGLPYSDTKVTPAHVYKYTVTEDKVRNYETTYGDMQEFYLPDYWEEVPYGEVALDGSTEYLIVDKSKGKAVNADDEDKVVDVNVLRKADPDSEFVTPPEGLPADTQSYFADSSYKGWFIKKDGGDVKNNYIKSNLNNLYLNKDGSLTIGTSNSSKLASDPKANGKLKLEDKALYINGDDIGFGNEGQGAVFAFYTKKGSYWAEVSRSNLDLTGATEYMIVDKSTGKAITVANSSATSASTIGISVKEKAEGAVEELPKEIKIGAASYFVDDGYEGWNIYLPAENSTKFNSYIESASDSTDLYIKKKDGEFLPKIPDNNDTWLKEITGGKIHIDDKYLKIADNGGLDKSDNENGATTFAFYKRVKNSTPPTYATSVTNTYIPGGDCPNETSVTVKKEWSNIDDAVAKPDVTIHLLQNGNEIDSCVLNNVNGWEHTFSFLPGTTKKLPYFDTLTSEVYDYSVEEDEVTIVDGNTITRFETSYTKTSVDDPNGGLHWIPYNESSIPGSTDFFPGVTYVLTADLNVNRGTPKNPNYVTGSYAMDPKAGDKMAKNEVTVITADDPATESRETFSFGNLSCSKELTSTVPAGAMWTIEPNGATGTYRLKANGLYLGLNDNGNGFTFVPAPKDKTPCCNIGAEYNEDDNTVSFCGFVKNDPSSKKYLRLNTNADGHAVLENDGTVKAVVAADSGAATHFTVFEQVSLPSKYDTYSYKVENTSTGTASADGKVENRKYIDYLIDNIPEEATENPDTGLQGDYYRIYLDAAGTRDAESDEYPIFKGVFITDHLSQYVAIADRGNSMALTVNKVRIPDPAESGDDDSEGPDEPQLPEDTDDISYLWYGNLNAATGEVGAPVGDGASVIKSVTYTRAEEGETDTTGMIRVEFQPGYVLEEGYKYVVSYNVEPTDAAKDTGGLYPEGSAGDPDTDYPGNTTSSGNPGLRSNREASIIYSQNNEPKVGIYDHPVIQVPVNGAELPSTGGFGSQVFIYAGLMLLTAAALIITGKRASDAE